MKTSRQILPAFASLFLIAVGFSVVGCGSSSDGMLSDDEKIQKASSGRPDYSGTKSGITPKSGAAPKAP